MKNCWPAAGGSLYMLAAWIAGQASAEIPVTVSVQSPARALCPRGTGFARVAPDVGTGVGVAMGVGVGTGGVTATGCANAPQREPIRMESGRRATRVCAVVSEIALLRVPVLVVTAVVEATSVPSVEHPPRRSAMV